MTDMDFKTEMKNLADDSTAVGATNAQFTALAIGKIVERICKIEKQIAASKLESPTD